MADVLGNVGPRRAGRAARHVALESLEIQTAFAPAGNDRKLQRIDRLFVSDAQRFDRLAIRLDAQSGDVFGQRFLAVAQLHEGIENRGHHARGNRLA